MSESVNVIDRNHDFKRWLSYAFQGFKNLDFTVIGATEVGDGYIGDVAFFEVIGDGTRYDVVLKYGKRSQADRESIPVRLCYEREIFVYGEVIPAFRKFEQAHGVSIVGELLPTCFKTLLSDKEEVVVLDNLKVQGYKIHDKHQPLDYDHFEMTFKGYGQWHALSLALRKNEPETFSSLFSNMESIQGKIFEPLKNLFTDVEHLMYEILSSQGDMEIVPKLQKRVPQGFSQKMLEIYEDQDTEKYVIFHHGDNWNNNFMFKYEEEKPSAVKFLDFQCSGFNSPVLDLTYHLYANGSEEEFRRTRELLEIYYSSLSSALKSFGCDAEELFPYKEFIKQWKKYSIYGIIMSSFVLPLILTAKEDTLDIKSFNEGFREKIERLGRKNRSKLFPRFTASVKHFLEFSDF